ncbi:hypothetical protein ACTPEO_00020 [Clostridioides difficile]
MLIAGGMLFSGIIYTFAKTDKSLKMDEQAQKKFAKAYERQITAEELVKNKQELTDNTLMKVANRKRAILSTSMNEFLKLYEQIMEINFQDGEGLKELNKNISMTSNISSIRHMTVTAMSPMTDKEIVVSFLLKGIGGVMVDESKRNVQIATSQVKISNVIYSQAETIAIVLDTITKRSERIAILLAKMNLLFTQSIRVSSEVINKNGFDRINYNVKDRNTLMTSINIADAIKKIIDTPLLDKDGELTNESLNALQVGSEYLENLEKL